MTGIKLCGLSRPCDIEAANALLPEYIGFVFAPKSKRYVPPETAKQLRQLLAPGIQAVGVFVNENPENIGALLKEAGTDYTKVIKTTCFLADMGDFAAFNEVYAKYFTEKPARSCVAVKTLPKNVLCEVEIIAAV